MTKSKMENLIIVGAAGRNAGKTTLVSSVINKYKEQHEIYVAKFTTIYDETLGCPRGGEGCGTCSRFAGKFEITEELDRGSDKDTSRLLRAGAQKSFWVKCLKPYIGDAFLDLLQHLPLGSLLICESNCLREVVDPGIFIICRNVLSKEFKQSAARVRELADLIVDFDGKSQAFDLDSIELIENKFSLKK